MLQLLEGKQSATLGFYFHVPFCPHLCPYCDFVKTDKFQRHEVVGYFDWMLAELDDLLCDPRVSLHKDVTVYFGGGTPGLFWGRFFEPFLARIRSKHRIEECTIECNPGFLSAAKVSSWKSVGFDRVTIGAQSLDQDVLGFLGRSHNKNDVQNAITWALDGGFQNIQADLIYGLPDGIAHRDLAGEIAGFVQMGCSGVSCYSLTIEQKTAFGRRGVVASDDRASEDYLTILECCAALGLEQRETSNFSRFECKHNNIYWHGFPYVGVGAGAHGLLWGSSLGALTMGCHADFGERYHYGLLVDAAEREQLVPGRDDFFGPKFRAAWKTRHSEGPRHPSEAFIEWTFSLMRVKAGIPGWLIESFDRRGVIKSKEWHDDAVLGPALERGDLVLESDGSLRVHPRALILGDHWHRSFLSAAQVDHGG
jgi:oxygen-independent coproporphyrinogen-3 oxidase